MSTVPQVLQYRSASRAFIGGLLGTQARRLDPRLGDLVTHIMWSGSFGILLSQSTDGVAVLWTVAPGQKRIQEDIDLDERASRETG